MIEFVKAAQEDLPAELLERLTYLAESSPFIEMLGIEVMELKKGYCKGRMKIEEKHKNPYGTIHGGCLYAFADTIAGIASCAYGNAVTTIDGHINFLIQAENTEYLYCEAYEIRQGRKVAVYDMRITNDRGEVVDSGSFTFFVMAVEV